MNALTLDSTSTVPAGRSAGRLARIAPATARVLLGLVFFVFGLNGFLNFMQPPETGIPAPAAAFFGALMATGYMIPLIAAVQVLSGALLLAGRAAPLALVLLAPVMVNIVAYHLFLDSSGTVVVLVLAALQLYLAWVHRAAFRPLFVRAAAR